MSKTFQGGVHPPDFKHHSEKQSIENMPLPETVVIPLQQHIGAPSECIVSVGDTVRTGQPLSKATRYVSVPVHASVSGIVKAIEKRPHPLGIRLMSVVIESDGEDRWMEGVKDCDEDTSLSVDKMKTKIMEAGMAGMGGAAFPTHVKLSPPPEKNIDTLILNGVECEPFLTSDHRLMLEETDKLLTGMRLLMQILNVKKAFIGIEENKSDAIRLLQEKTRGDKTVTVIGLHVKYPQGGEKQLIKAATGRTVPRGKLPMDAGCVVQNVGTAVAVYEAIACHKPLIERIVSVTGPGIRHPKNLKVRIGTPFKDVIKACGGYTESAGKLLNGGPMMGITQITDDVPVIKGTSGILVLDMGLSAQPEEHPCISCARCVDICPMKLMPNHIASFVEYKKIDDAIKYGLLDCIECGSCSYICPAKRHLVQYVKVGKALYNAQQQKQ